MWRLCVPAAADCIVGLNALSFIAHLCLWICSNAACLLTGATTASESIVPCCQPARSNLMMSSGLPNAGSEFNCPAKLHKFCTATTSSQTCWSTGFKRAPVQWIYRVWKSQLTIAFLGARPFFNHLLLNVMQVCDWVHFGLCEPQLHPPCVLRMLQHMTLKGLPVWHHHEGPGAAGQQYTCQPGTWQVFLWLYILMGLLEAYPSTRECCIWYNGTSAQVNVLESLSTLYAICMLQYICTPCLMWGRKIPATKESHNCVWTYVYAHIKILEKDSTPYASCPWLVVDALRAHTRTVYATYMRNRQTSIHALPFLRVQ